jgi:hypothetical protein
MDTPTSASSGQDAAIVSPTPAERRARRVTNAQSDFALAPLAFAALWIAPGFLLWFPLPPSGASLGDAIDASGAFWSGVTLIFHVVAVVVIALGVLRLGYVFITRAKTT